MSGDGPGPWGLEGRGPSAPGVPGSSACSARPLLGATRPETQLGRPGGLCPPSPPVLWAAQLTLFPPAPVREPSLWALSAFMHLSFLTVTSNCNHNILNPSFNKEGTSGMLKKKNVRLELYWLEFEPPAAVWTFVEHSGITGDFCSTWQWHVRHVRA